MKLCVVGLGLIGGSLALDLRARGFAKRVVGVDSSAENGKTARKRGLVREVIPLEKGVRDSDLIILAAPVDAIERLLPRILDIVSSSATVTDMGSTKEGICRAVASHPKRAQFVPSHPMSGTENSGPAAAFHGLFDHKTAVICDAEKSGAVHLARIEKMYGALKMRLIRMSSAEHDIHAAYISHLSHISSFVLANTVLMKERNVNTIFDLAGGGFESTVRLAKSSPEMWSPIFEQNRENVISALASYIEELSAFQATLVNHKLEETRRLMQNANQIRRVLADMTARTGSGAKKCDHE